MVVKWHGDQFEKALNTEIRKRILKASLLVERETKLLLGEKGGTTESGKNRESFQSAKQRRTKIGRLDKRFKAKIRKEKKFKTGTFTSKPGEPPRTQTGDLKKSMTHEIDAILLVGRVGPGVKYGKDLEFGVPSRNLLPRPFLRPALHKSQAFIARIFSVPWIRK